MKELCSLQKGTVKKAIFDEIFIAKTKKVVSQKRRVPIFYIVIYEFRQFFGKIADIWVCELIKVVLI